MECDLTIKHMLINCTVLKRNKSIKNFVGLGWSSVVEYLPSRYKVLGLIDGPTKKEGSGGKRPNNLRLDRMNIYSSFEICLRGFCRHSFKMA